MGRTLGSDFDDDDLPGGSLDLEKGSIASTHGPAIGTSYDGGGVDFDDPFADDSPLGSLELDLPANSPAALRSTSRAPTAPAPPLPPGGVPVPELSFGPAPSPVIARTRAVAGAPSLKPHAPPPSGYSAAASTPPTRPAPPSSHPSVPHPASSQGRSMQPASATSHSGMPSSSTSHSGIALAAPVLSNKPSAAAVIAKYPPAPEKVWQTPKYALQVLLRQFELRNDLESLRRRRSPDVPLYEAALRAYDDKTFKLGMALLVAMTTIFTLLFFSPVILRFVRAD